MTDGILGFLGGIGLFLFGMATLTAALRSLAGDGLRRWLLRMTSSPLRGVLTGAGITAVVQSSTAVTVMTIGFVGAGLISFSHSLGVLYGANIGTTATGWIIMIVGVKLKLGIVALPVLFVASLMGVLGEGPLARWGRMLAGLSLLFIGLDLMQASSAGVDNLVTSDWLPADTWVGRLVMVAIGLGLVVIMQSSSAGIALVLVLLGSGALNFGQAAAMVVGLNIGTTLTGLLASLGGSGEMLRAALANLLFNLIVATLALPLIDLLAPLLHNQATGPDDQTAIVLFHTGLNVLGAALFLPLTKPFAALVIWLVPDRPVTLAAALDPQLLADSGTALDAAARTATAITEAIGKALQAALTPQGVRDLRPLAALPGRVEPARKALETWLSQLHLAPDRPEPLNRMAALMHLTDHITRLTARSAEHDRISRLANSPRLARPARVIAAALAKPHKAGQAARLLARIRSLALRHRRGALLREHAGLISPADVFQETDALRWLDRVAEHTERIALYSTQAAGLQMGDKRPI
ncbi:MAG: Na/Pi symporter [Pseudotabrizicola sp.]|uniref:Na/Pi cotransporter family protein n=1 Tax=Pseudotabrizicola sp. TaxID=2939647 RepID=UPI00271AF8F5|nr:Na/Pi symporter [Pseudotabrizicola sp.]MDO8884681.1 Na/Pi symporter [Pseudotabrizicola sp.]MDP2080178.1 Na/Pi symporter [Pseudotabrizicola sp.]MDZ7572333.1 Na/Pi symporter [Pseudotabrizicola sp.]